MGCSNSSSAGGCTGPSKDTEDDTSSQEDKHRNYGGVYVGLPPDTTMCSSATGAQVAEPGQSYIQNMKPGSPVPENVC
ncbi:overexpressed in colon carcinoma 1 protein isoform X2 [Hyperolius riggenbachi]|uniref:overexpressed in colon carcinoma 1 protein isoform X2 n=1 Tax=Hyperolius riggenbachi TaxID=752182 RepID=UPI0035A35543